LTPRVDRFGRVTVRGAHYSVPVRLIGRRVRVRLSASDLVVLDGQREVARHARSVRRGSQTLLLDHYLEVLTRKPGALPGATALVQAREAGTFTSAHEAFWAAARVAHGDAGGTRALVEVLLLHRHMADADVVAGLAAAVVAGAVTADAVAVEARKAADLRADVPSADRGHTGTASAQSATPAPAAARHARVASLTERRLGDPAAVLAGLPADTRPPPSVAHYDELLLRRPAPQPTGPAAPDAAGSTTGRVS